MAEKKLYIGSVGPYLFEDDELINDLDEDGNPTGDFDGQLRHSLVSDRQALITEAPSDDNHLARYIDLLNERLFRRHTLESGDDLIIDEDEQKLNLDFFNIRGTGSLTIVGSGELCIIGG